jgi:Tfp pilus assembly protein PilE
MSGFSMTSRAQKMIFAVIVLVCALFFVGIVVGAAVTGYRAAMRAGNEAATIQNLKTIAVVEIQYSNSHNRNFATLDDLVSEQLISAKFSHCPTVTDGYVITLTLAPKSDGASWYKITADPQDASSGKTHFYFDSTDNRIRVKPDRQAGPSDPFN